jgi:hypothetical protein
MKMSTVVTDLTSLAVQPIALLIGQANCGNSARSAQLRGAWIRQHESTRKAVAATTSRSAGWQFARSPSSVKAFCVWNRAWTRSAYSQEGAMSPLGI